MRIICDAPDQTCNRLWTYVALAAQCIAEQKIIFRAINEIIQKTERITRNLRKGSDIVVRTNIWHGAYKSWHDRWHYYTFNEFHSYMQ
jgi:hypothetical protein